MSGNSGATPGRSRHCDGHESRDQATVLRRSAGREGAASRLKPKPGNLPGAYSTGLSGRERKVLSSFSSFLLRPRDRTFEARLIHHSFDGVAWDCIGLADLFSLLARRNEWARDTRRPGRGRRPIRSKRRRSRHGPPAGFPDSREKENGRRADH